MYIRQREPAKIVSKEWKLTIVFLRGLNVVSPEGNTRTVVMLLTFFVEHYGYHMDQELLAESAGYVRDAFVMASLDQFSEYEHLERILLDAVCTDSVDYELTADAESEAQRTEKYQKYHRDHYTPEPHYRRDN